MKVYSNAYFLGKTSSIVVYAAGTTRREVMKCMPKKACIQGPFNDPLSEDQVFFRVTSTPEEQKMLRTECPEIPEDDRFLMYEFPTPC